MATGALVSVSEYLATSYHPDREYVAGVARERHLGEFDHSRLQLAVGAWFYSRRRDFGIQALTEQRVQVLAERFRIPDVCVVLGQPREQILTSPPFICIEILSKDDGWSDMQERIDDYLAFGVRYVWVIDPGTRRAWHCTTGGTQEVHELRTADPEIALPLADLFD
jgi:Uma2 family endonuclease